MSGMDVINKGVKLGRGADGQVCINVDDVSHMLDNYAASNSVKIVLEQIDLLSLFCCDSYEAACEAFEDAADLIKDAAKLAKLQ